MACYRNVQKRAISAKGTCGGRSSVSGGLLVVGLILPSCSTGSSERADVCGRAFFVGRHSSLLACRFLDYVGCWLDWASSSSWTVVCGFSSATFAKDSRAFTKYYGLLLILFCFGRCGIPKGCFGVVWGGGLSDRASCSCWGSGSSASGGGLTSLVGTCDDCSFVGRSKVEGQVGRQNRI